MNKWIMHIDMDAFFASIEILDNPDLKDKPVVVGHGHRGVVCAASYVARKFGIRSAMPLFKAEKLCPQAVFVSPRFWRYKEISKQVMKILLKFSPLIEQASIDEAYLDISGFESLAKVEDIGFSVKKAIFSELGLTCSVGIAPVKFLAKIASDLEKPDGISILEPDFLKSFLKSLPVSRVPGVGEQTGAALTKLGIFTLGDVLLYPKDMWIRRFGKIGISLWEKAQGIDESKVIPFSLPKSESAEITLDEDSDDLEFLKKILFTQVEKVSVSVRGLGAVGKTVNLKIKFSDFKSITRSYTLPFNSNSTRILYKIAVYLLDSVILEKKVRLIGFGLSNFNWGKEQLTLPLVEQDTGKNIHIYSAENKSAIIKQKEVMPEQTTQPVLEILELIDTKKDLRLDETLDKLRQKFGKKAVVWGRIFNLDK